MIQVGDQKLEPPIVTLQVGKTLYTFRNGDSTGKQMGVPGGLAALGLLQQFETVWRRGTKVGSVEVDSAAYDVYHYATPAESVEAWFDPATLVPLRWLSKVRTNGSVEQGLIVFAGVEINVAIPDELLKVPKGLMFSK